MSAHALIEKIKSRGYWRVVVRPARFEPTRIAKPLELYHLIEANRVRLGGWVFPFADSTGKKDSSVTRELQADYVQQTIGWEHYLEVWRFYQSGQFIDLSGMGEDWRDQSGLWAAPPGWNAGQFLGTSNTVTRFTEIFAFTSRLATTKAGDDQMHVSISLYGLKGRQLYVDDPRKHPFSYPRIASIPEFAFRRDLPREELIARSSDLALEASQELFQYFEWDAPTEILRGLQQGVLR